ncbi:MAG: hypothetical protein ACYDCK_11795 [Thermoplasmatota archaeon]
MTSGAARSPTNWQAFDRWNLVFYDVNRDGLPEIVASNDDLRRYVIDPRSGLVVARLAGSHPGGDRWSGCELGGATVGDVLSDGHTEIVIGDGASSLSLWCYNATGSNASHSNMSRLWEHYVDTQGRASNFNATHPYNVNDTPAREGYPFLANVDRKGQMTVFAQADSIAAHVAYDAQRDATLVH